MYSFKKNSEKTFIYILYRTYQTKSDNLTLLGLLKGRYTACFQSAIHKWGVIQHSLTNVKLEQNSLNISKANKDC